MATGDVQGSVERLRSELRHIRYPAELDCTGAKLGVAAALLPVLNYVLLKFSRHVAHQLVSSGYELQGKTDARFVEAAFKIFRDKFGLRPVITAAQFLEQGFAERKLMLLSDVITYCKSYHNAAVRRARLAAASAPTKSGKDASTSSKAGASQASKGSRKSKSKSGLAKASQPARVQRHSAAVSEADMAAAASAATLQARLAPSAAQLASPDHSQNIDPNPWGPPAHAVGTSSLHGKQAMMAHTSGVQPGSSIYSSYSAGAVGTATAHQGQQQQQQPRAVLRPSALPSRTQPRAGSMLEATQAWFMNPAFGGDSPLPSPEKQPRSQPPPQPHPSTCTGPAHPSGYPPAGHARQAASLSGAAASWTQASPAQHRAADLAGHAHEMHHKQVKSNNPGMQWRSSRAATPQAGQHQQASGNAALEITSQSPGEAAEWSDIAEASACQQLPVHPSQTVAHGSAHGLHHRHVFANQAPRQHQQQTSPDEGGSAQHGDQGVPGSLAQQPPQHAQQGHFKPPSPAAHGQSSQQYQMHQQQQQQQPPQGVVAQDSLQGQPQQHQQQGQQQEAGSVDDDNRMSRYVWQLQERLAEAEEQAAQARLEGDRRVQTLEARITVLEGRVRFVEGELAAAREQNRPTAKPNSPDTQSPYRAYKSPRSKGEIAVCMLPSKQQATVAAAPAAIQRQPTADVPAVPQVTQVTASMQRDGTASSPTRSTAGTPAFKSSKYGGMRQLGLGASSQQSPMGIRHNRAAVAPASPASSMHSYKSTSELIESIQNRYLEAQSFLKSYKL